MPASMFLSLKKGLSFSPGENGELLLRHGEQTLAFRNLSPGVQAALVQLGAGGADEDRLVERLVEADDDALARFYHLVHRLAACGLVRRSARADGVPLATLVPMVVPFSPAARAIRADQSYLLSRFACTRRDGKEIVVESPRAPARVVLHDGRAAALIHALGQPRQPADLGGLVHGLPADAVVPLLTLLDQADLLQEVSAGGSCLEDRDPILQSWEFHDLLFHARHLPPARSH